jgi:hypothetical protein
LEAMSTTRPPFVRTVTELRLPFRELAEMAGPVTRLSTYATLRASKKWIDLWFSGANRVMDAWWRIVLPPRG